MQPFKLNNNHTLAVEPYKNRLRLVVFKDDAEIVCRKEAPGRLKRFLLGDEERLLKGRLQLVKTAVGIGIEVKGEIVGEVLITSFKGAKI